MADVPSSEEVTDLQRMTNELLESLVEWYAGQQKRLDGTDPHKLARMAAVALTSYAAAVAVDDGMSAVVFEGIAAHVYREALKKAPRFG